MPVLTAAGRELHYEEAGEGAPVLLVPGAAARARTWSLHQVPALTAAGYRVVSLENRGAGSPHQGPPLTLADLVADAVLVAERVIGGPCRLVGHSMGAAVVAEILVARPDLAAQAVLMASRARPDAISQALKAANRALAESGVTLPPEYVATVRATQNLSPHTLADDRQASDWLTMLTFGAAETAGAARAHAGLDWTDRRAAYAAIRVPTLVVSFADDVVTPSERGLELAGCIPGARHLEIPRAGHYGYLEQPDAVNTALLDFFRTLP